MSHIPSKSVSESLFSSEAINEDDIAIIPMPPFCFTVETIHLKGGLNKLPKISFTLNYYSQKNIVKTKLTFGEPLVVFDMTHPQIMLSTFTNGKKISDLGINIYEYDRVVMNKRYIIPFLSSFHCTNPLALESTVYVSFSSYSLNDLICNPHIEISMTKTLITCDRKDIIINLKKIEENFCVTMSSKYLMKALPLLLPTFTTNETHINIDHRNILPNDKSFQIQTIIPPDDLFNYNLVSIPSTENSKIVLDRIISSINWNNSTLKKRTTSLQILNFDEKGRVVIKHEETFPGYFIRINQTKKVVKLWLTSESMWDWVLVNADGSHVKYEVIMYPNEISKTIVTNFGKYNFQTNLKVKVPFDIENVKKLTFQLYELEQFSNTNILTIKHIFPIF